MPGGSSVMKESRPYGQGLEMKLLLDTCVWGGTREALQTNCKAGAIITAELNRLCIRLEMQRK